MTKLDFINNVLVACGLPTDNLTLVSSTATSIEYNIEVSSNAIPTMIKSQLRETSYSDELADSDNNSVLLKFSRCVVDDKLVNAFLKLQYNAPGSYTVVFQIVNYITYDLDGQEHLM